jgi:hypothetical protein
MFDADDLPAEIVPALQALAAALTAHVRAHPNATLSTHEQGVLAGLRAHAPALLAGVLQAATAHLHRPQTPVRPTRAACPSCPRRLRPQSRVGRARTVLTRLGPVRLQRPWYHCRACRAGWSPADQTLGLAPRQRTSPGLQQWEATLGARLPFAEGQRVLAELTGLALGTETVRIHTEQVGAQVAAAEQAAIAHVLTTQDPLPTRYAPVPTDQPLVIETDGVLVRYRGSGWHAVKVAEVAGCVLGNGRPRDDPAYGPPQLHQPTYTAAREPTEGFDARLLARAAERGALDIVGYQQPPGTDARLALWGAHTATLRPVVILADGAPGIWALAARCFGEERVEIVAAWHAVQHLWTVGKTLYGEGSAEATAWVKAAETELWEVGPLPVLQRLKATVPPTPEAAEVLRIERAYFTTNAARMRYPQFRPQGLPVGSGAIESAARHLVQQRLKGAGMRWSEPGPLPSTSRTNCTPCCKTPVFRVRMCWLGTHWAVCRCECLRIRMRTTSPGWC